MSVNKGDDILMEGEDLLLLTGMFDLIDRAVQMQNQVMDTEGNPGGAAKAVAVDLVQKSIDFTLQSIERENIIVIDIVSADNHLLHGIAIVLRNLHHFIAEIAADPEDEALVRVGRGIIDQVMTDVGRNQDNIALGQRVIYPVDVHADIAAQEEIELIVGV